MINGMTGRSTLAELRSRCEALLGAQLASLTFRGGDGTPIRLITEGCLPALGALLIGEESRLLELGVEDNTTFMAAVELKYAASVGAKRAGVPAAGKAAKKAKAKAKSPPSASGRAFAADSLPCEASASAVSASGSASSSPPSSSLSSSSPAAGPASTAFLDAFAMNFLHAGAGDPGGGTLNGAGLASHFQTTVAGQKRVESAAKGLVAISDAARAPQGRALAELEVVFRTSAKGAASTDRVRRLSVDECVQVAARILFRGAGSRRRRAALLASNGGRGPSTKVLTTEALATRCPDVFWSLYDNSREDRSEAGNVLYALDHVIKPAVARFEELVQADAAGAPSET